jgi:hypothetical protein
MNLGGSSMWALHKGTTAHPHEIKKKQLHFQKCLFNSSTSRVSVQHVRLKRTLSLSLVPAVLKSTLKRGFFTALGLDVAVSAVTVFVDFWTIWAFEAWTY